MKGQEGATAVEYAILLASIATILVVAVSALGINLSGIFSDISDAFPGGCAQEVPQEMNPNC